MQDDDYFRLMLSVFLVLMMLVTTATVEWTFRHPEAIVAMSAT